MPRGTMRRGCVLESPLSSRGIDPNQDVAAAAAGESEMAPCSARQRPRPSKAAVLPSRSESNWVPDYTSYWSAAIRSRQDSFRAVPSPFYSWVRSTSVADTTRRCTRDGPDLGLP